MTDAVAADIQRYYRSIAPLIDAELERRGDEQFWRALAAKVSGDARILEVGCGTGRVTRALASSGARVVGIDLSAPMLARAALLLAGRQRIHLLQADVRRFALNARFDLVIAANDPFSHLLADADRDAALECVAAHLAQHGRLVIEALWFSALESDLALTSVGRVLEHDGWLRGQSLHVREAWRCDAATRRCQVRYDYELADHQRTSAEFEARYWDPEELATCLGRAGLRVSRRWGDYRRSAWSSRRSPKLIVEATAS